MKHALLNVIKVDFVREEDSHSSLHMWVGPMGFHLFCPDLLKSRFDWCAEWREPILLDDDGFPVTVTRYK